MGAAVGGAALRRRLRVVEAVVLCAALIGIVAYAVGHVGLTSRHGGVDEAAAQPPANVVQLHWTRDELVRAPAPGHICVSAEPHGRICASFAAGERPATALTRAIERRGLRVSGSVTR